MVKVLLTQVESKQGKKWKHRHTQIYIKIDQKSQDS